MPDYHALPFLLWCLSGSRTLPSFFMEVGAAISVASTTVPAFNCNPLVCSSALTVARICSVSLWRSSRCLKRRMFDSLEKGYWPRRPISGAYGSSSETNSAQCTANSIALKNSRLRVRLTVWLRPRLLCFMLAFSGLGAPACISRKNSCRRPCKHP